ncbi:right-handed parallel beta-helix repeat-containing protein [Bacillus sp. JCM 19041]|uniref:right-handed parallel beta-helix repeat-containing protein n=1 Tax=Bacillus sp. JCM 19041 TaxID=1460637 RepID=UPI0006CFE362
MTVYNSSFYHHNDLYPQIYLSDEASITMKESRVYESYESGLRFDNHSNGLIEHCQFSGHFEAQIDVHNSTPTIRESIIENGGTCAIRLLHAGGFIENCTFNGHEHNIAIGGECQTEIIGQEADALRQYAEALSQSAEMEAQLSQAEAQEALIKAQENADREARTAEIVGLVEELEQRLGKK